MQYHKIMHNHAQASIAQMRTVSQEISERRASKFLNRALPEPPAAGGPSKNEEQDDENLDNLYELVSQNEGEGEEEWGGEEVTGGSKASSSLSSCSHKGDASDASGLDYYLEPRGADEGGIRPRPAPRGAPKAGGGTLELGGGVYSTDGSSYVNTKRSRQLSTCAMDPTLSVISAVNYDTLRHLGDELYARYTWSLGQMTRTAWCQTCDVV